MQDAPAGPPDPAIRERVFAVLARHPGCCPGRPAAPGADPLTLVLARDGHPIAHADSHGAWLEWRR